MVERLRHSNVGPNDARANVFSALSDPTRLRIFQALVDRDGALCVSELCDRTDLRPNLVSHHLQCLIGSCVSVFQVDRTPSCGRSCNVLRTTL